MINLDNNISFNYLKEYYNSLDIAEVFGISSMEIKHSNFLKWIFQPSSKDKALEYFPIRQLLKTIQNNINTVGLNEEYNELKDINIDKARIENVEVLREKYNIDFVITVIIENQQYVVAMENKLEAPESDNQLSYYRIKINEAYPNANKLFILLHPNYEQLKLVDKQELLRQSANENNYISITYQDIYDNMLKEYLKLQNDNNVKFILSAYIHTLCCYNTSKLFGLIVTDVEKEHLEKLFNDETFINILSNIKNNTNVYKQNKEVLLKICAKYKLLKGFTIKEELSKVISSVEHPKVYKFDNKQLKSMHEFAYIILSAIVKEKSINNEDDFGEKLKNLLFGKYWYLSKWYEGIENEYGGILDEKEYEPIKIGKDSYYSTGYVSYIALLELYDLIVDKFPEYKDRIEIL